MRVVADVSIQPDPRPGISRTFAVISVFAPLFQSNPTLGQEYRFDTILARWLSAQFQSNPTLGQEYRSDCC